MDVLNFVHLNLPIDVEMELYNHQTKQDSTNCVIRDRIVMMELHVKTILLLVEMEAVNHVLIQLLAVQLAVIMGIVVMLMYNLEHLLD
jgi:hypothetical protein